MYILNRFATNCEKSMMPFHATLGLCWYVFANVPRIRAKLVVPIVQISNRLIPVLVMHSATGKKTLVCVFFLVPYFKMFLFLRDLVCDFHSFDRLQCFLSSSVRLLLSFFLCKLMFVVLCWCYFGTWKIYAMLLFVFFSEVPRFVVKCLWNTAFAYRTERFMGLAACEENTCNLKSTFSHAIFSGRWFMYAGFGNSVIIEMKLKVWLARVVTKGLLNIFLKLSQIKHELVPQTCCQFGNHFCGSMLDCNKCIFWMIFCFWQSNGVSLIINIWLKNIIFGSLDSWCCLEKFVCFPVLVLQPRHDSIRDLTDPWNTSYVQALVAIKFFSLAMCCVVWDEVVCMPCAPSSPRKGRWILQMLCMYFFLRGW